MRAISRVLRIDPKTVKRKLIYLSGRARIDQEEFLGTLGEGRINFVYFDDLETHEHTKLKPLSVTLAVTPERKILGAHVSQMPAKGLLAQKAFEKYGPRKDQRKQGFDVLMSRLKSCVHSEAQFRSDQNPHYPIRLKRHFPACRHDTVKGQRGCIVGQGELKKVGFDPLFSLNHTCAMLRAHISRLVRRTWNTTKKMEYLQMHLDLYISHHNRHRTKPIAA